MSFVCLFGAVSPLSQFIWLISLSMARTLTQGFANIFPKNAMPGESHRGCDPRAVAACEKLFTCKSLVLVTSNR